MKATTRMFYVKWTPACLSLAIVGGVLWSVWPRQETWVAADGSRVTLLKTTYGKVHEHLEGGPLAHLQKHLARSRYLAKLKIRPPTLIEHRRTQDSLTIWFEIRSAADFVLPPHELWLIEAETRLATRAKAIAHHQLNASRSILAATFENLPHGSRQLRARLIVKQWEAGQIVLSGHDFRIKSPVRRSQRPSPTGIPAKGMSAPELIVSLNRLEVGTDFIPSLNSNINSVRAHSSAVFTVLEAGRTSTNWAVGRIDYSNSLGDGFSARGQTTYNTAGETIVWLEETFWPSQAPWKIRAEFVRRTGFEADAVWDFDASDAIARQNNRMSPSEALATNTIFGCTIVVLGLRPSSQPGSGGEVSIQMESADDNYNLIMERVLDAGGEIIPTHTIATSLSPGRTTKVFQLDRYKHDESLRLRIAVQKGLFYDFFASPLLIHTNAYPEKMSQP